jgi:Txe/YoeB family toxin of Txe-Axe toxin-antitoxin module
METLGDAIQPKLCPKFYCKICDYYTSKKSSFDNHNLSAKHKKRIIGDVLVTPGDEIKPKICSIKYQCENCNKSYESRNGLWKHKNSGICSQNQPQNQPQNITNITNNNMINGLTEQLVIELIKQNKELLEIVKNGTNITNTNVTGNTTNSHNKAFNLQFFLNETCKEAMNMTDFIDSLTLQLSDLEDVGEKGYIQGISNIIVKNLKELDVTKRPVHCTDKKRETVYIKDNNIWEKDEDRTKMHKLIKKVVSKNMKLLPKYRELHPDCMTYYSKFNDQYQSIIYETMGGKGDNDFEKNEKIIKNILKEVVVKKADEQSIIEI